MIQRGSDDFPFVIIESDLDPLMRVVSHIAPLASLGDAILLTSVYRVVKIIV